MELQFTTYLHVSRPRAEVFEAVADPAQLSQYFTTGGAQGRLSSDSTVTWDFHDFPGRFPVEVGEVVEGESIVFRWPSPDGAPTTVTMRFSDVGEGRTKVEISEEGWPSTPAGLNASYGNCQGWSQMLAALKAWVEHGINLRDGAYI
ncbi:MAG: SRPBCC domain-containing protein [Chthonomonas sp.]|nr:SRPBCC domain-containing protein [Chthonomonas sp.]